MTAPDDAPLHSSDLEPRLERCRRVVDGMAEAGMGLVRALDPQAPGADVCALALAYARISRAVRLSLMLDLRLDALAGGGLAALIAEQALASAAETPEAEADAAETQDAADPDEPREGGRLSFDREAPDEALRYLTRPLTELVGAICKGLNLPAEQAQAAQAPFEALIANDDGPDDPDAAPSPAPIVEDRPAGRRSSLKTRLMAGASGARGYACGP